MQLTLQKLQTLKLNGMADALRHQLDQPEVQTLSFDERLTLLVDQESLFRENRRLARLLKEARLRLAACPEDIDYRHPRGLNRDQVTSLLTCDWIRKHQNLALSGPTGAGKTWMACAFGNQACRQGLTVRYMRLPRLFESLRIARGDGSYSRLMNQLAKTTLLILDDWGIQTPTPPQRNDLLEVIEDRYAKQSTLIASQLPVEHWHDHLGEATLADAILDRLLHNAHRIQLTGDSMRKFHSDLTDGDRFE